MTDFDKTAVAESFGRAAATYDGVADLQRTVGGWLLQAIQRRHELSSVLDVGCGSGALTVQLAERVPLADVEAIDIAEGMLDIAAERHAHPQVGYYVGDAEAIPFEDKSFELVFCNFVLQWCPDPVRALTEMRRVLRRNGQLVLSLPGAGSLGELAAAWRAADGGEHVHAFPTEDDVADWVGAAGFAHADITAQRVKRHAPDALALMKSLKALGAHNLHPARANRLTGKAALQRVIAAYEAKREPAGLPVTWQVLQLVARR